MSSDLLETRNLIGDSSYSKVVQQGAQAGLSEIQTLKYKDKQLLSLPDRNNNDYSSGQIQIDTGTWEKQWKVLRNCRLAVPFTLQSSVPTGATAPVGSGITPQDYTILTP